MRIVELSAAAIREHADELAELMRASWSDSDGRCYYPYKPFTSSEGWRGEIAEAVERGVARSWAMVHNGSIVGHAAIVQVWDGLWESGRWVVSPSHRGLGINTQLVKHTLAAAAPLPVVIGCSYYAGLSQLTSLRHGCYPVGLLPNKFSEHGTVWGEVVMIKHGSPKALLLPTECHTSIKKLVNQAARSSNGMIRLEDGQRRQLPTSLLRAWRGEECCLIEDQEYQRALLAAGKRPGALLPCSIGWKVVFTDAERPPMEINVTGRLTANLGIVPIHCPTAVADFLEGL